MSQLRAGSLNLTYHGCDHDQLTKVVCFGYVSKSCCMRTGLVHILVLQENFACRGLYDDSVNALFHCGRTNEATHWTKTSSIAINLEQVTS